MTNAASLFLEAAARDPDATALFSASGEPLSFRQLRSAIENFGAGLLGHGFRPGDRAVFMLPMSPELYVAVLGTLNVGGIAAFVDPWVPIRQIARMAAHAEPAAFVGTAKSHFLRLLEPRLRSLRLTVSTDSLGATLVSRVRFSQLRGRADTARVPDEGRALITYTTGSSGLPKGVNRTHGILAAQHRAIREEFPARAGDVDLTTFPVFALANLASGIATVIPPVNLRRVSRADPDRVLRAIRLHHVTTMAASPPLFDLIARRLRRSGEAPPPLRRIVTGGAPVRDDQLRLWRRALPGTEIIVAYGSSEAEPVAGITADDRLAAAGTSPGFCVGAPVAAVRTRVVRIVRGPIQRAEDVPIGTVGELLVSGEHVCRDYDGDNRAFPENKLRDERDPRVVWHRMGDTGYFDAAGRFWLVGRVHSTITRRGEDLHAQLIEEAVRGGDERILRIAALGLPDDTLDERVVVVVQTDTPGIRDELASRLANEQRLPVDDVIVTRKALPVDPRHNSKIDYGRLRAMILEGKLS